MIFAGENDSLTINKLAKFAKNDVQEFAWRMKSLILLCCTRENAWFFTVHRRIGGMEVYDDEMQVKTVVHRRIGGMEVFHQLTESQQGVHRRIGGMEERQQDHGLHIHVHRRIGGMEASGPAILGDQEFTAV